jgi:hypothetical protein
MLAASGVLVGASATVGAGVAVGAGASVASTGFARSTTLAAFRAAAEGITHPVSISGISSAPTGRLTDRINLSNMPAQVLAKGWKYAFIIYILDTKRHAAVTVL